MALCGTGSSTLFIRCVTSLFWRHIEIFESLKVRFPEQQQIVRLFLPGARDLGPEVTERNQETYETKVYSLCCSAVARAGA